MILQGTWRGGREKAPAAFCRKVIASDKEVEMWGDGEQTRSFLYVEFSLVFSCTMTVLIH